MKGRRGMWPVLWGVAWLAAPPVGAQPSWTGDPVLRAIGEEGLERSRVEGLAQVLTDSLGPRLTGSPESEAASHWVADTYRSWGVEARQDPYGTWLGWRRGLSSVGLLEPRVRTLEATLLAWSPGTNGPRTGAAITVPRIRSAADLEAFVAGVRGSFVLLAPPEPSCRPAESWERWGEPGALDGARDRRAADHSEWALAVQSAAPTPGDLIRMLEEAGAAGVLTSSWAEGWGAQRIHDTWSRVVPTLDLSCEDYGLVYRLAENGQGPVLRVDAEADDLGEVPVWNTIGLMRGSELPDEYVILSAHFDSWDGATGATDNGTGTVALMEAVRILRAAYPNPKRSILVAHWNGEEQGLNGSRAFVADNPEIVEGLQLMLNQDEGTGRITRISMQGLAAAPALFQGWLSRLPEALGSGVELVAPGAPAVSGSDDASFICAGAPAFRLSSLSWDYGPYTWHTNRDTFDKIVFDDLRRNATLIAMLAYLASEAEQRFPRERVTLPDDATTGRPTRWPACQPPLRSQP